MKNVKFVGNLKKDIEMANKKFNLTKMIISEIIICITSFILYFGICFILFDFSMTLLPLQIIVVASINTIAINTNIKKEKKKFENDKQKAQEQLISLVYSLQRENVCTNLNQLQNSKVQEKKITSTIKDNDSKVKTKEISRNIYFLDNLDALQILREKRNTLNTNGNIKQDNSLMLLEESEIPELELNVEKVLVLKRKS